MKIIRSLKNPIIKKENIKPSCPEFTVTGVFNCGAAKFKNETVLLLRVAEAPVNNNLKKITTAYFDERLQKIIFKEFDINDPYIDISDSRIIKTSQGIFLSSISHLRLAKSKNGLDFIIEEKPAIFPQNKYERMGIEDPRITCINDKYYITYVAVSEKTGITTCMASTDDFINFKRHGVIFLPDNKDTVIFPEKIDNFYYALSRPESSVFGLRNIWISKSPDLLNWGEHEKLLSARSGKWDGDRIGAGAVPFMTDKGWLEIYHGVLNNVYSLGVVILDSNNPKKIVARSDSALMIPEAFYEINGFFKNVIFTCAALYEEGKVKIYYGAADESIGYAETSLEDILSGVLYD